MPPAVPTRPPSIPGSTGPKHPSRRGRLALVLALVVMAASAASAETYMTQLEWIHPSPEAVRRFFVLYAFSPDEREQPTAIDVGKPMQVDRFVWGIDVPERSSVWVAVVAEGWNAQRSPPSEWRRYDWRPGQGRLASPGRPYLVQESAD